MLGDTALAAAVDQRVLATGLRAAALRHGGVYLGTAAQILALGSAGPGWPASAVEMEARGLPELAERPGFAGVTVTREGRRGPWQIRADAFVQAVPTALPPSAPSTMPAVPIKAAAAPIVPPAPATDLRQALAPTPDGARAREPERLRVPASSSRAAAATEAAWAAANQALSEVDTSRTGPLPSPLRTASVQAAWTAWLNASTADADAKALEAARREIRDFNLSPPPRAA
jgi:hypothetical protein